MDILQFSHVRKNFGSKQVLKDISFSVPEHSVFGFIGPNGAGKTTAMRMLCGLSRPTAGKATVGGYDVATESEQVKKHIGYMSQKFALYDDLTVRENLMLYGGKYGMNRRAIVGKTEEVIASLQLGNQADALVKSLPLGRKQKLAFAVSIFHNPSIVFLDEPTGGVDADTRKQFWQAIYSAARSGISVFVTTHYMDEAEYCDRVSIMVDGKIEALDTPANLKRHYGKDTMYDVFMHLARQASRS